MTFLFLIAELVSPVSLRQMVVTNLRNQPLSSSHLDSINNQILSLYHDLVTGSKEFPHIAVRGLFHSEQMTTTFTAVLKSQRENTTPSPSTSSPAGMMVLPAGCHLHSQILTPVLPDKVDIYALNTDRRNCVHTLVTASSSLE